MKTYLCRFLVIAAISMLALSTALWADKPLRSVESEEFVDLDPCTGQPTTITLYFDIGLHFHKNNFVAVAKRSGETSSGYHMVGGHETYVENYGSTTVKDSFVDNWHGNGRVWQVGGVFVYNWELDAVRVDKFVGRCLKG